MTDGSKKMSAEKKARLGKKITLKVLLWIAVAASLFVFMIGTFTAKYVMVTDDSDKKVRQNVDEIVLKLDADSDELEKMRDDVYGESISEISLIASILKADDITAYSDEQRRDACEHFADIRKCSGSEKLYVVNSKGDIFVSSSEEYLTENVVGIGALSKDQLNTLISQADNPDYSERFIKASENGEEMYYCIGQLDDVSDNELYIILGIKADVIDGGLKYLSDVSNYIGDNSNSDNIRYYLAVDYTDGTIVFADNDRYEAGRNISEYGIPLDKIKDNNAFTIGDGLGMKTYVRTVENGFGKIAVVGISNNLFIFEDAAYTGKKFADVFVATLVYLIFLALIVVYGLFLKKGADNKKKYFLRMLIISMVSAVVFSIGIFLLESVSILSDNVSKAEAVKDRVDSFNNENNTSSKDLFNYYLERSQSEMSLMAYSISACGHLTDDNSVGNVYYHSGSEVSPTAVLDIFGNPLVSYAQVDDLIEKAKIIKADEIMLINEQGYAIASSSENWNYNISNDKDYDSLMNVLCRNTQYDLLIDNDTLESTHVYSTDIYLKNENGNTVLITKEAYEEDMSENVEKRMGLLLVRIKETPKALTQYFTNFETGMRAIASSSKCSIAIMNVSEEQSDENTNDVYTMNEDAYEYIRAFSVPEKMEDGSLYCFRKFGTDRYFIHVGSWIDSNTYLAEMFKCSEMYSCRLSETVMLTVFAFVLFVIFITILTVSAKEISGFDLPESMDSRISGIIAKESRKWSDKKPEERIIFLVQTVIVIMILYSFVRIVQVTNGEEDPLGIVSILQSIYSNEWERAVSVYNVISSILVLVAVGVIFSYLKKVVDYIAKPFGKKAVTYLKLMVSIVQYSLMFASAWACFYLLGMDKDNIVNLAAVFTGVVGIGSRNLVSDIGAGFFTLAEGKVMVGDYVSVEGFVGTIKEIGIRTTTIEAKDGRIKNVANGSLKSIIYLPDSEATNIKDFDKKGPDIVPDPEIPEDEDEDEDEDII